MEKRLHHKTCIVTGANQGIGRAIAYRLLEEGANVVFADIATQVQQTAANAARDVECGQAIGVSLDATKRQDVQQLIQKAVEVYGSLDVMLNNIGVNKPMNFLDVTEQNWDFIMRVNALSVLIGTQEAAKQMIRQGSGGKIVNTASVASRQGYDNVAPYCAAKHAVKSLTQSGARALAEYRITVNGFAPGVVATEMWKQLDQDLMAIGASEKSGQAMAEFSKNILLGRASQAEEIAGTAAFLASSDSDAMTGQIVMIDGGMELV